MRQIKILYIIGSFQIGGSERNLIQIVEKIDRNKFLPYVCCIYDKGKWFDKVKALNVKIYLHKYKKKIFDFQGIISLFKLSRICRRERIDIIQTYGFRSDIFGALLSKLSNVKNLIIGKRNIMYYSRFHMLLVRLVNRLSTVICVNSYKLLEWLVAYEKCGRKKVRLIYNGVDAENYNTLIDKKEAKGRLGLTGDSYIIGTIASFCKKKGYIFLIEAFKDISRQYEKTKLVMVGTGPLLNEMKNLAETIGIEKNCVFLGERDDIPQILAAFDVFALASVREGMPNVLMEAMAAGKACVVTNVGGNEELITDGRNGFIVPLANPQLLVDRMRKLLEDSDLNRQMGQINKNVIQDFSINRMIESYTQLYYGLMRRDKN